MLIIKDVTLGKSYPFPDNKAGFFAAKAKIDAITGQGHKVGGDVSRVLAYTG